MSAKSLDAQNHRHWQLILEWAEKYAATRDKWISKNKYFHTTNKSYLRFLIPENLRVLELGCGTGQVLASLRPSYGVGADISPSMLKIASETHQNLEFRLGNVEDPSFIRDLIDLGPFDVVLLDDTLGYLNDIQAFLDNINSLCNDHTRLVSTYHSYLWEPAFIVAGTLRMRMPTVDLTWLRMGDVENFFSLSGFQTVKREWRLLLPFHFLGFGSFINRYIAPLPLIRKLCLRNYLVARVQPKPIEQSKPSVSIVIPCRNERGNIEDAVRRLPRFTNSLEIVFVEGHSTDGTWEEILRVQNLYKNLNIRCLQQTGEGKGDAVRAAFDTANGDVLIILDADLTVRPEDIPKFYNAISMGKGEYINGSRLVYSMESGAMFFLNYLANHLFARIFTYLLNQSLTDTLCGTKAISKYHYEAVARNRDYFGNFDPFGDFDLIFGASKLNLSVVEVPIRYSSRKYGQTQISRFKHGLLLIRMVIFAYRKLKAV